ncbi:uncharacterized protein [Coffea arabica]|uniref:Flocculation protein FLO11-like n=1 Tax=Coffea arabica TaxID=13443 RepID=A0ABM4X5M1_COFAR
MELFQEIQEVEESGFDSAAVRHHLNSTTVTTSTTLETCTGCGSIKRRSPSSSSFSQEPSPKRATHYPPPSSTTTTSTSPPLLPSPPPSSSNAMHANNLHHSLSETTALTQLTNPQSPDYLSKANADISASASPSAVAVGASLTLPPLPPVTLWRLLSDHTSSEFQPTPQPARRTLLRSPTSDQESLESKSLKKIKQKLKVMSQWVEKVMREEDEEYTHSEEENCNINSNSKQDASEKGAEAQPEEAVWVEKRNGEDLVLHFKCPCSKGYEIFLSGNTCYYRLM